MVKLSGLLLAITLLVNPNPVFAQNLMRPVQVQNVTTSTADLLWKSASGGSSAVKFGKTTSYELGTVSGSNGRKTIDNAIGFLHRVTLTSLTPGTKYYYQVLTNNSPITTAGDLNGYVQTSPNYGSSTPFRWAVWGDSGNGGGNQKAVATQVLNKRPELSIVAGDVVYGAGYGGFPSLSGEPQQDANHFDIYSGLEKFSPFYLACGNHDNNDNNTPAGIKNGCDIMIDEQVMPNGGRIAQASGANDDVIYSFNYGNIHFTIMNTNPESSFSYSSPTSASPQSLWAYNDIKNSNQPWKIVVWHTNGWSSGSHANNSGVINGPILMAQDAGAHVVLWGHSHVYERFSRFATQGRAGCATSGGCRDKGPYYYTIGNGGQAGTTSACGSYSGGPQCIAASGLGSIPGGSGFLDVQANGNQMTFNYITQTGVQADTKTINLSEFGPVVPPTSGPSPTRTPTLPGNPSPTRTPTRTPTQTQNQPSSTPIPLETQPPGGVCVYYKN